MAGYSGTPLATKLGIKEGHRVALISAPSDFESTLEGLPPDVILQGSLGRGLSNVIVLFAKDAASLEKWFPAAQKALDPSGGLWVAWPKRASGVKTDLTENTIRDLALASGLVDNKVCAI